MNNLSKNNLYRFDTNEHWKISIEKNRKYPMSELGSIILSIRLKEICEKSLMVLKINYGNVRNATYGDFWNKYYEYLKKILEKEELN
jgi:hypothetical protein